MAFPVLSAISGAIPPGWQGRISIQGHGFMQEGARAEKGSDVRFEYAIMKNYVDRNSITFFEEPA